MSQENLEVVRRIYDGGLIDRAVADMRPLLDPDVEYVNPADAIEPGTRRGIDDVIVAFGAVSAFETATSELRELFAAGDSVVAEVTFRARSRSSDVELTQAEAHTWTFRNGEGHSLRVEPRPDRRPRSRGTIGVVMPQDERGDHAQGLCGPGRGRGRSGDPLHPPRVRVDDSALARRGAGHVQGS